MHSTSMRKEIHRRRGEELEAAAQETDENKHRRGGEEGMTRDRARRQCEAEG